MGKGDKRSRKGKIFSGSYGNTRRRKKKNSGYIPVVKSTPKVAIAASIPIVPAKAEAVVVETTLKKTIKKPAAKPTAKKVPVKKPAAKKEE